MKRWYVVSAIDKFLIEQETIPQLASFFHNFKKRGTAWNFRCPICGDSEKSKLKSRGYIYVKGNTHSYKCHNCGASLSLYQLVKEYTSEDFFKNFQLQLFKSKGASLLSSPKKNSETVQKSYERKKAKDSFLTQCKSIADLPESHPARKYLEQRKIDSVNLTELYFVENFASLLQYFPTVSQEKEYIEKFPNESRIIIPYYDTNNRLVGLQGRAIGKSSLRYITLKIYENEPMIYGLHRWNKERVTFITEGPIDSLFLPNALAVAGADFIKLDNFVNKNKAILILDNEPRNKQICEKYQKVIELGWNVVIWEKMKHKDINDMILAGYTEKEILAMIRKNCYNGTKAKLQFAKWKRIT